MVSACFRPGWAVNKDRRPGMRIGVYPVGGQYANVQGVAAGVLGELGAHADTQQPIRTG